MADSFSDYYSEQLDATYDCVDRIVLNAYFLPGHSPAGFRSWWRLLKGSDDELDNAHLMRFAGRVSRRIRAYASENNIPIEKCHGEQKRDIAQKYLPENPNFVGVFLIVIARAPATVFDIQRSKENDKIINIAKKKPLPYVNHYSFHIMDPEWGHITIKMCGHAPFKAQIMLNGHEYVARQAQKEGIEFTKEGNCFTEITDAHRLGLVAETSSHPDGAIGRLTEVCERWIYSSCLCFALDSDEQQRSGFRYRFFTFQAEYSRNLLFTRGRELDQIFNAVIDHTRKELDVKRVKTIFGVKKRPARTRHKKPRLEFVIERPAYDLTVFKIHFGALTVKIYSKGERVLRVEVIVHNAKALGYRRSLDNLPQIISCLKGVLERFLETLSCLDVCCIAGDQLDELPKPGFVGQTRVGGVDINSARIRSVVGAVVSLAPKPHGFTSSQLAQAVQARMGCRESEYTPRKAAYDLKKLRGKNLIRKIEKSRRYETVPEGLRTMAALLILREKIISSVLAGVAKPKPGPKPKNQIPIDKHYRNIQSEMRHIFRTLGIAA
ncbi:MAG: hypothetical protein ACE5IY_24070 [bacterium]